MEKFYCLSANCSHKYRYLNKLISGDIDIRKKCENCGHYVEFDELTYQNLVFEVSKNGKYPDCIMYGGSPNFLIVSQNTLDIFIKESITGFKAYLVSIMCNGKLIDLHYYILKIYGRAIYNYKKMGKKPLFHCEQCGYTKYPGRRPLKYEFTYLKDNSWDGSDMFLGSCCDEKVIETIRNNKLTGFNMIDIKYSLDPYCEKYIEI